MPYNHLSNSSIKPRLDSNVFEYHDEDGKNITVFELYSVKSKELFRQTVGSWDPETNTLTLTRKSKYERRKDLGGITLVSVFEEYKPICVQLNTTTSHGIDTDVLNALAQHLNFTYTITFSPERLFDAKLANGTWIGRFAQLSK